MASAADATRQRSGSGDQIPYTHMAPTKPGQAQNYSLNCISALAGLAIFIIGCIALSNGMDPKTLGYTVLGLAAGSGLISLITGAKVEKIRAVIFAAIFITLGALTAHGLISVHTMGWTIVGSSIAALGLGYLIGYGCLSANGCSPVRTGASMVGWYNRLAGDAHPSASRPQSPPPSSSTDTSGGAH